MISNPHRTNSDFQLRHFIAGTCFTADGAWLALYAQQIDLKEKLEHAKAQLLRREATRLRAEWIMNNPDIAPWEKLTAEAELIEMNSTIDTWKLNVEAAKAEHTTCVTLMAELEPMRKYAKLPILEASEAAQREEWLAELKYRAENYLITTGTIPHDQLAARRQHPDFETAITPHILLINDRVKSVQTPLESLEGMTTFLIEHRA